MLAGSTALMHRLRASTPTDSGSTHAQSGRGGDRCLQGLHTLHVCAESSQLEQLLVLVMTHGLHCVDVCTHWGAYGGLNSGMPGASCVFGAPVLTC